MATQTQTLTKSAHETASGASKGGAQEKLNGVPKGAQDQAKNAGGQAKGVGDKLQGATSGILSSIEGMASKVAAWGYSVVDRVFPPEQRASLLAKLQEFMLANPKISTFLGMNIALTGVPLGLFILFTLVVAIFSLVVGIVLGLLAAVFFTLFCVGIALVFVLPTVLFTTAAACFLFLWGLGGYYILKWANGDGGKGVSEGGSTIGDKLNSFTGGRLTGFMDSAKAEQAKGDISGYSDQHTKPKTSSEGGKKAHAGEGQKKHD